MVEKKKSTIKKTAKKKTSKKSPTFKKGGGKAKYWQGIGRRKTCTARVRIFSQGTKDFIVNEQKIDKYFPIAFLSQEAVSPIEILKLVDKFKVTVKVKGGGIYGQAQAIRHGLSRALVEFNPNFRKKLKKAGFLTRDPRMKERKKFGLKKARRAPQWKKR